MIARTHAYLRKVNKDRTVRLHRKVYETPVGLIGKTIMLLYHGKDLERIEAFSEEQSCGFLTALNPSINSRVPLARGHDLFERGQRS